MNDPDLKKVITQITQDLDCGMICYLNTVTGEVESVMGDSWADYHDYDDIFKEIEEKVESWEHSMTFEPLNSHDSYEMMEHFVDYVLKKGSPTQRELAEALVGKHPFARFKSALDGHPRIRKKWFEFKESFLHCYVIDEMKRQAGASEIKTYPLDDDAISIMALGVYSGRYVYCSPKLREVVVSSVVTQPGTTLIPSDDQEEIVTHYTIEEEIRRIAEQHFIFKSDGGITFEPVNVRPGHRDERTLQQVERDIRRSVAFFFKAEKHLREFLDAKDKESQN